MSAASVAPSRDGGSAAVRAAESSGRSSRSVSCRASSRRARRCRCSGLSRSPQSETDRISTGIAELDRVLGGGLVPASVVLVGGEPGRRQVDAPADGARRDLEEPPRAARQRRGVGAAGEAASVAAQRLRRGRDSRCDRPRRRLRDARTGTARGVRHRLDPDVTRRRARLPGGIGGSGTRGRSAAARARQGGRHRCLPGRSCHQGRIARRPARARAPGRLRPAVRGRPLPLTPRTARDQEPFRLDERARPLRDDEHRARRRLRPLGAVRSHRAG